MEHKTPSACYVQHLGLEKNVYCILSIITKWDVSVYDLRRCKSVSLFGFCQWDHSKPTKPFSTEMYGGLRHDPGKNPLLSEAGKSRISIPFLQHGGIRLSSWRRYVCSLSILVPINVVLTKLCILKISYHCLIYQDYLHRDKASVYDPLWVVLHCCNMDRVCWTTVTMHASVASCYSL